MVDQDSLFGCKVLVLAKPFEVAAAAVADVVAVDAVVVVADVVVVVYRHP
jgi:hypothetical protein